MSYFVLVYDRQRGRLVGDVREFADTQSDEALQFRFALEREQRTNPAIEVMVLGSPSREALEITHARYFRTPEELAARG